MDIDESLQQILAREEIVADFFYDVFLDRYPEIRQYFVEVDLKRQAVLLSMALVVLTHHYSNQYPATEAYLKYLGSQHDQLGVPTETFPKFREALLTTLERFHGHDWSGELAGNWKAAIDLAADTMRQGYGQRPAV